jgi:quinol monooxygenase YgiN
MGGRHHPAGGQAPTGEEPVEPVLVTMRFETDRPEALAELLARYVVLTRTHPGCRNVDLVASMTAPGRFLVVSKWATVADQQRHFDGADLAALAEASRELLRTGAELDLYDGISMHDLA